jgi:hypothetical protein
MPRMAEDKKKTIAPKKGIVVEHVTGATHG